MVSRAGGTGIGACCWPVDRSRVAPPIRMAEPMPKTAANAALMRKGSSLRRVIGNYLRCLQSWHHLEHRSWARRFTAGVCKQQADSKIQKCEISIYQARSRTIAKSNGRLRPD